MPPSSTDKTKTVKNKNSKTIIQEAFLNIAQCNTNSPNNDGRPQQPQQAEKRNHSSSSKPIRNTPY